MHPQDTTAEEWRPVVGWEGWYSVSSAGRVRRDDSRYILHARPDPQGYLGIGLSRPGYRISHRVHTLVAAAFLGPRLAEHEINHIDGNKARNRPGNLEYCTGPANKAHAQAIGLLPKGPERARRQHEARVVKHGPAPTRADISMPQKARAGEANGSARLSATEVQDLRRLYATGQWTQAALAVHFGISRSTSKKIIRRELWRNLP